jgi:Zn-dependent M28 family amino/carboxypeptidase
MNARAALRDIDHLADDIGPREATSENFTEAAKFVQNRFKRLGYDVRLTRFRVPSGISWGTPVPRGTSLNVIADPEDFDAKKPHVVIGAHLDTVPVAPGAEDNASGVAVMLQLAAMVSQQPAAVPVRFIAFGAEEPRGSGDALHHFGSRKFVADLSGSERRAIEAMVSLDRVGVRASYVPVCTATDRGNRLRNAIRAAGRRDDIPTRSCTNFASDHWSFAKAGVPAVRLGSIPYAGYHSRADVPRVVDRRQLDRVGRTVWAWLLTLN